MCADVHAFADVAFFTDVRVFPYLCAWLQMRVPALIWAPGDTSAMGWM
jgi:hypothetical protein